MLGSIENQDFSGNSLGGNQVWILGHVPSPVYFASVIYFLDDLNSRL
jgi:hypothetical protein